MEQKGFTTVELIVLISSMTAALGGAYLGADYIGTPKHDDEKVIIIDTNGEAQVMELQAGKSYDATITPDGRIIVKEKAK